jgi:hypothetical protein
MLVRILYKLRWVKTYRKHLIGLVENEHLDVIGTEDTALNHVLDTTGGSDNDLRTVLESLHVLTDVGTTNASMALNAHEVTNGNNDLLDLLGQFTGRGQDKSLASLEAAVDLLESGNGEGSGFTGTGLSLSNDIVAFLTLDLWLITEYLEENVPLMTGMIARCWIAEGRSKP